MLLPYPYTSQMEGCFVPLDIKLFPRVIPGTYLVSNLGFVYDLETNTYLPKNISYNKDKYITIKLKTIDGLGEYVQVHRLVGYHFLYTDGCEELDINHKDCIKFHNWSWNLEWMTHKDNMIYAVENNSFKHGQDRKSSKLSNKQVIEICKLIDKGLTNKQIKEILYDIDNINLGKTITNIRNGHCWNFISKDYSFRNKL